MPAVSLDRRTLLKQAAGFALAGYTVPERSFGSPETMPNPVGYSTIAWSEDEFDQSLETISALGFKGVQVLGWVQDAYEGPRVAELQGRLRLLRLEPVALSCSKVRVDPADSTDLKPQFRSYASFFQRLGGRFLQVTDRGKPGRQYSVQEIRSLAAKDERSG